MNEALEIIEYELKGIYSNIELIEKTRHGSHGSKERRALAHHYWIGQAEALERTRKLIQIRQIRQLAKEEEE